MSTTRRDLVLRSGTTLGAGVQYETPDSGALVSDLVAGDRVWYEGAAWSVFSNEAVNATRWRLRLGDGFWWEPDLLLPPDSLVSTAVARTWDEVSVRWRDPYGRRMDLPHALDEGGVTLVLVPHTAEARQWSADFGRIVDGSLAPPAPPQDRQAEVWRQAYDYDLNATFVDLEGTYQVLQGTLIVQPSVAVPEVGPLVLSEPGRVDLYVYRGDSGQFRVTVTDPDGNPVDVSAGTWLAEIRASADSTVVMATLDVVPVGETSNAVDVVLSAEVSASLASSGVWDLELTLAGSVVTLVSGSVILTPDVTH